MSARRRPAKNIRDSKQSLHLYSVGEVCSLCGVTRKTLFYYDRVGLLRPAERIGAQKFKFYDAEQLNRLKAILEYRDAGLMISEISKLLDGRPEDRLNVMEDALNRLQGEKQQTETEILRLHILIEKEKYSHQTESPV